MEWFGHRAKLEFGAIPVLTRPANDSRVSLWVPDSRFLRRDSASIRRMTHFAIRICTYLGWHTATTSTSERMLLRRRPGLCVSAAGEGLSAPTHDRPDASRCFINLPTCHPATYIDMPGGSGYLSAILSFKHRLSITVHRHGLFQSGCLPCHGTTNLDATHSDGPDCLP
jgi:hypothetical protein